MDRMEAEVQIAILDACASGAITRLKGGRRQKAFMVDASSDMRGYAFLTSSSEDEAAQESDAIGASFFSHYLVSGLRGAADVTGDGRVTLNEAYHFAFQNTLEGTERTQGGAQHPAYDIKMTGTGDVVMTDVRQTSAGLILAEALQGRFFIRNANRQLIAELFKPAGRRVELGLEPGAYRVHMAREVQSATTSVELAMGQRAILDEDHFEIIAREHTTMRGGIKYSVKRSRIELRGGYWNPIGRSTTSTNGLARQSVGSGLVQQNVENLMGVCRLYLSTQRKSGIDGSMGWFDCRDRAKCGCYRHIPERCHCYASAFWGKVLLVFGAIPFSPISRRKRGILFFARCLAR